ncbi:MAG: hypothetical protein H6920_10860 [Sphingomonadaceae bacterium]|jgi:hypothetical protein|nr:hypothetical protein [Sphingomonadaceae bacterium]
MRILALLSGLYAQGRSYLAFRTRGQAAFLAKKGEHPVSLFAFPGV